jgi:hypothetical protein
LAGLQLIAVHGDAHAAAGFRHSAACLKKNPVQPFASAAFNRLRSRHDQRAHAGSHPASLHRCAALRKSEIRPFVQLPINTTSMGWPSNLCFVSIPYRPAPWSGFAFHP